MDNETFADYILSEKDWGTKLEIMYYLKRKTGIHYNNTVIFKTVLAKMFLDYLKANMPEIELEENTVITARLLCDCLKIQNSTNQEEIKSYASKGAKYLASLGFDEKFCKICEGVNRYTVKENRPLESDFLELVDQFGGMLLDRPERVGFAPDEALVLLQYRNLKDKNNKLLPQFISFVNFLQEVEV